jgi:hypothetical protein
MEKNKRMLLEKAEQNEQGEAKKPKDTGLPQRRKRTKIGQSVEEEEGSWRWVKGGFIGDR